MSLRVILPAITGAPGLDASLRSLTAQPGSADVAVIAPGPPTADLATLVESGIERAGGDMLGWLPPGDTHLAWTLRAVTEIFTAFPDVDWIASLRPAVVDAEGICESVGNVAGFARDALLEGRLGAAEIQAPATFFRRSLWERAGSRFPVHGPAAASSLWARFFDHADLVGVDIPLAVSLARPPDPARRAAEERLLAELRARDGVRPRVLRRLASRLGLGRLPRVGEVVERAVGYAGRRLLRPDRGPGRFQIERYAFS